MLARIRKSQEAEGFTLIELLVVMIIIGILAAIAIPVFLNQRKKAQDSAAKADVSTLGKELATYFVDSCQAPSIAIVGTGADRRYELTVGVGSGTCTTPTVAIVTGTEEADLGKVSDNVELAAGNNIVSDSKWCIGVVNDKGDKAKTNGLTGGYKYSAKNGLQQGQCVAADSA